MAYVSLVSLLLLGVLVYKLLISPLLFHSSSSLGSIPNAHPTSSLSSLWINWIRHQRRESRTIHAAFRKHGPVVRLAPREIAINCVDSGGEGGGGGGGGGGEAKGGIQRVYGGGGLEKHEWYSNLFDNYGVPNMFSMVPNHAHSIRKRMLSHIYSKSFIQKSPVMQKITRRLLYERFLPHVTRFASTVTLTTNGEAEKVEEDNPGGLQGQQVLQINDKSIDVLNLFSAITMDFVSAYQFGLVNGTKMLGQEELGNLPVETAAEIGREEFFELYRSRNAYNFWPQEHPRLTRFLRYFGIRLVPLFVDAANSKIEDMIMRMCDAAAAFSDEHFVSGDRAAERVENTPVVYAQLSKALAQNDVAIKGSPNQIPATNDPECQNHIHYGRRQIASELLDHLAAGFETSGITLTYAAYELSRNPDIQTQLRSELRSLDSRTPLTSYFASDFLSASVNPSPSAPEMPPIPDAKQIDELPLLHAVLLETLRLHSAIPSPQPRVTPSAPSSPTASSKKHSSFKNTSKLPAPMMLGGHGGIPGGTRVSAQAYSLHRNADVFADPESWQPQRWLTSTVDSQGSKRLQLRGSKARNNNNGDQGNEGSKDAVSTDGDAEDTTIKEMYRWFWAFGSGGRMCVGSNLAMYQMKFILAALYANFSSSIVDDTGIEQRDSYTAPPISERLLLRFQKEA